MAKTLLLLDDEEKMSESDVFLNNASQLGSGSAAFLLWQKQYQDCVVSHAQTFCVLRLLWIINVWIAQRIFKGHYIDGIDIIFYVCDFLSPVNLIFNFFLQVTDRARNLQSIRQLREIAKMNNLDSKLSLCKMYANGMYGGISQSQAAMFVQELVQSTTPSNTQECFKTSQELTTSMR